MLSGTVLKQFRTYLKSQVGHGWSVEGRKSKRRYLTRVSFRYISGERSVVLLDIDFDADCGDLLPTKKNELSNNFFSYGIDNHKHYPEILQEIRKENSNVSLTFIPHLLPIFSGIQSNIYFDSQLINAEEAFDTLKNFYQNEIFVKIFKNKIPKLSEVQNTNYVRIGVFADISKRKTIIISTIDNLVKGAAGQAIQNMNLMFGFNESESLV